jgi:hypothetical protein
LRRGTTPERIRLGVRLFVAADIRERVDRARVPERGHG